MLHYCRTTSCLYQLWPPSALAIFWVYVHCIYPSAYVVSAELCIALGCNYGQQDLSLSGLHYLSRRGTSNDTSCSMYEDTDMRLCKHKSIHSLSRLLSVKNMIVIDCLASRHLPLTITYFLWSGATQLCAVRLCRLLRYGISVICLSKQSWQSIDDKIQ